MKTFPHGGLKAKRILSFSLLLSLAALFVTILLIDAHYRIPAGQAFCNLDSYWNCDKVNKSIFASLFGIPVSVWGFAFYSFFSLALFGQLKGYDFSKHFRPLKTGTLLLISTIVSALAFVAMAVHQVPYMPNLAWLPVIQNLLAIFVVVLIYKKSLKLENDWQRMLFLFTQMAFGGVVFAFYLSNFEFFVLEAICIYCVTQQTLIILTFLLLGWLSLDYIKTKKHE